MRPKKQILLVGSGEDRLGVLAYMLETNGYALTKAFTLAEAFGCMEESSARNCEKQFSLLFCVLPFLWIDDFIEASKRYPATPTIVIREKAGEWTGVCDATLNPGCSSKELLERIEVMTARKRGPRKGYRIPPIGQQLEAIQRARPT